jgi:hypothetical protein
MLRISVITPPDEATVTVEGRLAGPWVAELERCWRSLAAMHAPRSVRVELDAVTFIDASGKTLLGAMYAEGATLVASGCKTRALLEEFRTAQYARRSRAAKDGGD